MPLGIPHSVFLNWAPDDQDKALAWAKDQASRCPNCGTRQEDWDRDRFAYIAETRQCPGCEVIGQERRNIDQWEQESGNHHHGVSVVLVPKALARSARK